jgi:hypothetical protein
LASSLALGFTYISNALEKCANRIDTLEAGVTLVDWVLKHSSANLKNDDILLLARANVELWFCNGLQAETKNLRRARELYETVLATGADLSSKADTNLLTAWYEYAKVLSYLGDLKAAVNTANYIVTHSEGGQDYVTYLLFAASLCMSDGSYGPANDFLFSVCQFEQMPRQFTRSDVLFVIARNIEQHIGGEVEDEVEDAYRVVRRPTYDTLHVPLRTTSMC